MYETIILGVAEDRPQNWFSIPPGYSEQVVPAADDSSFRGRPLASPPISSSPILSASASPIRPSHVNDDKLLDLLLKLENQDVDGLDIQLYFTKDLCQPGVPPRIVEQKSSYKEGDELLGFITIDNNLDRNFDFAAFLVVLEGVCTIKATGARHLFLQMLDLGALYNPARINRFASDTGSPHVLRPMLIDPVDDRQYCFHNTRAIERCIRGNRRYKRFFAFTIPPGLLDCECPTSVQEHLMLPHSGRNELFDITYSVTTRIIGSENDSWFIYKQGIHPITVVPNRFLYTNSLERSVYSERLYLNLLQRIDDTLGSSPISKGKMVQIPTEYSISIPIDSKLAKLGGPKLGGGKNYGNLRIFCKRMVPIVSKLYPKVSIPITLEYTDESHHAPPKIKQSLVTLHEIDFASERRLPFGLGAFLFNNPVRANNHDPDTLDILVQSTRKLAGVLVKELEAKGTKLNAEMVQQIKAICKLKWMSTSHNLPKFNTNSTISKRLNDTSWQQVGLDTVAKCVTIEIDHRHFAAEKLVPSWQECMVGKMHILKVTFVLSSGQKVNLKLPLNVCD